jgi:hypothetical protein
MKDSGNESRAVKVASASKKFSAVFGHPLSGSGSLRNSSSKEGASTDGASTNASDENKFNSTKLNFDNFSTGSGSRSSSRASGGGRSDKDDKASTDSGAGENEDSRRLSAAIEARDKLNKDKYQSSDEQTIFEKVTNAYIRNYDKVLTKKKDRDNIEQNQQ